MTDLWLGAGIDMVLVLAPAFAFIHARGSTVPAGRIEPRSSLAAALGLGAFGLFLLVELPRLNGAGGSGFLADLVPLAALFVFGAALEERWRGRGLVVIAVAVLATNDFMQWAVFRINYPAASLARVVMPFVAAGAFGAFIRPMTRAFSRLAAHPLEALIACNALNVADALLTAIGVHGGLAVESNPVVRVIGLRVKVVLVALLSLALLRTRPRALIWPVAALAGVVVWHLAGFLGQTPFAWWT